MKWLVLFLFYLGVPHSFAQNIQGRWIGKLTQQPGGYSQLYDLELNLSQRKTIWGDSFAYEGDSVRVRIGLSGYIDRDSIILRESPGWIREDIVPWTWVACIKNFILAYRKDNDFEYLEGRWTGVSKEDQSDPCKPGKVILARSLEGLNKFLEDHKDSVIIPEPVVISVISPPPVPDFSSDFQGTAPNKVTEIEIRQPDIQIQLIDYLKVDNDTVSVFLNRKPLARNIRIDKRPVLLSFRIDKRIELHEILLYAENLGRIPPNTSEMIVVDGDRRHRVMIVSDKEKTAAVYLRYKPGKGS